MVQFSDKTPKTNLAPASLCFPYNFWKVNMRHLNMDCGPFV